MQREHLRKIMNLVSMELVKPLRLISKRLGRILTSEISLNRGGSKAVVAFNSTIMVE